MAECSSKKQKNVLTLLGSLKTNYHITVRGNKHAHIHKPGTTRVQCTDWSTNKTNIYHTQTSTNLNTTGELCNVSYCSILQYMRLHAPNLLGPLTC